MKSEVGTKTVVMTYRQEMHQLRNVHLTHSNFTVHLLGTVNI